MNEICNEYDFLALWHFLLGYCLGFNLVKTQHRDWAIGSKDTNSWTNNEKQKKLSVAVS